jgi:peptidoglycan hydrolase-like protein with peptidoglycan-binding domain
MNLRNVMRGSKGPDVLAIQQGLNKYYRKQVLKEDGVFGSGTDTLVRKFQEANGMAPPDGIVGPITRSTLFPLVATTVNLWANRTRKGSTFQLTPPTAAGTSSTGPTSPSLSLPSSLTLGIHLNEFVLAPGLPDRIATPKVATPPGGKIVVDWQQITQTQRQFDGLFTNPQDSFAVGWQSVFKRKQLDPSISHLEIATGCVLQSPVGIQDAHGNDLTIACFAQATWVEPLGKSGNFAWAPYAQVQGQGNPTGPANIIGSFSAFPIALNVDLTRLDFDDVTLQLGAGVIGSLKFTPDGLKTVWGPQIGVGLTGKIWFLGN